MRQHLRYLIVAFACSRQPGPLLVIIQPFPSSLPESNQTPTYLNHSLSQGGPAVARQGYVSLTSTYLTLPKSSCETSLQGLMSPSWLFPEATVFHPPSPVQSFLPSVCLPAAIYFGDMSTSLAYLPTWALPYDDAEWTADDDDLHVPPRAEPHASIDLDP